MTLPASRNTTYAAGSQVQSADLNACQDGIIAVTKEAKISYSAAGGSAQQGGGGWERGTNSGGTNESSTGPFAVMRSANSTRTWDIPIRAAAGYRITFLSVDWENNDGAESLAGHLVRSNGTGISTVSTFTSLGTSAGRTTSVLSPAPSHDVVAGEAYWFTVNAAAAAASADTMKVYKVTVGLTKVSIP